MNIHWWRHSSVLLSLPSVLKSQCRVWPFQKSTSSHSALIFNSFFSIKESILVDHQKLLSHFTNGGFRFKVINLTSCLPISWADERRDCDARTRIILSFISRCCPGYAIVMVTSVTGVRVLLGTWCILNKNWHYVYVCKWCPQCL